MAEAMVITATIRNLLRARHKGADWFLAFEVRDQPGFRARKNYFADAIAMNTWPSRGFALHGYEFKVSRSDWKKELENPEKADGIAQHCDYWWLVAPKDVALESEIPPTWGFMLATEKRLRVVRDAPLRLRTFKGETRSLDRAFAASLLRRRHEEEPAFQETLKIAVQAAEERKEREFEHRHKTLNKTLEDYKRFMEDLEAALGTTYAIWFSSGAETGKELAAARSLLQRIKYSGIDHMDRNAEALRRAIAEFKDALGGVQDNE